MDERKQVLKLYHEYNNKTIDKKQNDKQMLNLKREESGRNLASRTEQFKNNLLQQQVQKNLCKRDLGEE